MQDRDIPLCVDLDGTLIRSDVSIESALCLLRRSPFYVLSLLFWLMHGRSRFKREIARRTSIDVSLLPYDTRIVDWVHEQRQLRQCVLCTASDQILADAVVKHTGLFDIALGSDGVRNLSGSGKAKVLVEQFGERGFDYAGNANADMSVWSHARYAIVVNAAPSLLDRARCDFEVSRVFPPESTSWTNWIRALRLHQWLKNLLVFLPLLAAHLLFSAPAIARAGLAFVCFSLCASGVYLLNDMLDLEADRRHPRKRLRPFAAGSLSLFVGLFGAPLLALSAFALARLVSPEFALVLCAYYALTLAYSFALKRIAMLDAIVLAGLYTVRVIAGAVAIQIGLSFWLLAFSMFLFLSLAMLKRYTELHTLMKNGRVNMNGRGYTVDDLPLIQSLGSSSGFLSALVLALYINSTASEVLYRHQQVLWLLCPLLLYWISRAWLIAHRGDMHDDPVVFALVDRVSCLVLALCAVAIAVAI